MPAFLKPADLFSQHPDGWNPPLLLAGGRRTGLQEGKADLSMSYETRILLLTSCLRNPAVVGIFLKKWALWCVPQMLGNGLVFRAMAVTATCEQSSGGYSETFPASHIP